MSHRVLRRLLVLGCTAGGLLIPVAVALACASPTISTSASSGVVGQGIRDVAVLSGGSSPKGTISWKVYGASDTWCSKPLNSTSLQVSVSGNGTYTSPDFVPSSPGSYQWVATYSGDGDNYSVAGQCNDKNEVSWVSKASPAISTTASSSTAGGPVDDVAMLSGGDAPTGMISWNVYASGTSCATPLNSTPLTASVSGDGTYTSPDFVPSSPGSYQWVATYSGDADNTSVVSACNDSSEVSTVSQSPAPGMQPAPGIHVVKLQRVGSSGAFTTGTVNAQVGQTIEYEIQVTNTGNTPLTLSLSDPRCNAGTIQGPVQVSGTLTGDVLSPGGVAQYTCSHVLTSGDSSPFTNTGTVTGQPPSGPAVSGTSSVTANKAAVKAVTIVKCKPGKVKTTKKVHGKKVVVCVAKKRAVISRKPKKPSGFTG